MKQKINSLLATLKTIDAFGIKYAADYPVASLGGQQFALVRTAVGLTAGLGTPVPKAKPAAVPAQK